MDGRGASLPHDHAAVTTERRILHSSIDDKGKIERFFRTLRAGWLGRVEAAERETLETLNRSLWAWIEGEYHNTPHRGLDGRTPLEQWALASAGVRYHAWRQTALNDPEQVGHRRAYLGARRDRRVRPTRA